MLPLEAMKTKEGAAFLAGGLACYVLAALLAINGIQRFLEEDSLRDAIAAFHRDSPEAHSLLIELKQARPGDATLPLLLGCLELDRADRDPERLAGAERLFEEALAAEPTRSSAAIGLAVARLRLGATKSKEARAQAAKTVSDELDRAPVDPNDPNVKGLRAGIELVRGRTAEALKLLDGLSPAGLSRDGQLAWRWNRAMAACLTKRGDALEDACAAYALRRVPMPHDGPDAAAEPLTDGAKLLVMAYRVALAEGSATPSTPDALLARCELARRALAVRSGGSTSSVRGRYLPPVSEEATVINALGIAYTRLERWTEAAQAFDDASRAGAKDEPRYNLNLAETRRRQAAALPDTELKQRNALISQAADAYDRVVKQTAGKEGREAVRVLAATNGAALLLQAKQTGPAFNFYAGAATGHPNEAERARNLGALMDHNNNGRCVDEYRRAISLSHPDSAQLERRIRARSR